VAPTVMDQDGGDRTTRQFDISSRKAGECGEKCRGCWLLRSLPM